LATTRLHVLEQNRWVDELTTTSSGHEGRAQAVTFRVIALATWSRVSRESLPAATLHR